MTEASQIEREEYGKMDAGQSASQYRAAANALMVSPHCGTDSCTCKVEEPAEAAWVKLMSAVPQATQINNLRAGREGTMMLPEGQTIQSMVASIRPQPEADYALDTIRDAWIDFYEEFRIVGPKIEQGLTALSSGWKGVDFDAFEEQAETVVKNCRTIQSDIGGEDGTDGVIKVLDTKQSEIFEQQGGTACVYPAPKFYMEGTKCGSHRIHIRPPFFRNCEIRENDETKAALELAGFDPMIVDEVSDGRQRTYDMWMEFVTANPDYTEGGLKGEELATSKAEEYATQRLETLGPKGASHLDEEAARVNEEVTERHSNVEAQVTEVEPDVRPSQPTTFNEGMTDLPGSGGLDTGGGGGMPDLPGGGSLDGMTAPSDLSKLDDSSGFGSPSLSSTTGGGGGSDLPSAYSAGGTPPGSITGGSDLSGIGDENPFSAGLDDPDNLANGGLTGGGGYGGSVPGSITGGSDLTTGDNPWSSSTPLPEDASGGLASGGVPGSTLPPSALGGGGGGGGLQSGTPSNLMPPGGGSVPGGVATPRGLSTRPGSTTSGKPLTPRVPGGTGGRVPGATGTGGRVPGGLGSTKGLTSGTGGGRPGGVGGSGSGLRPGGGAGGGTGSGLRSGGVGGAGAGGGMGRGGVGGGGVGGTGAGRGGVVGGGGMLPGGAAGRGAGEDGPQERKVWLVEDDDVWGGVPEDEEDDPYA
ncbi:hypothetical protein [Glycomyces sp. NRRL B-16210]|uniref:hypothetical protein n=1 Tax=Glycomyces sp. NRRL B-16210 TaxID=1463821 RepID=UPI00068C163E|nr:hypothetical protein [Glycomyces sp. NRRL B-16210]